MNEINTLFIIIMMMLVIVLSTQRRNKNSAVARHIIRKKGEHKAMKELAERFIEKDCIIETLSNGQITGVIKEIVDNSVLIEEKGLQQAVNLEYVVRIREYPHNEKGKRKSIC